MGWRDCFAFPAPSWKVGLVGLLGTLHGGPCPARWLSGVIESLPALRDMADMAESVTVRSRVKIDPTEVHSRFSGPNNC